MADTAGRITALVENVFGTPVPMRVRAWDGSEAGPPDGPVLVVRDRRALRRLLFRPGKLGLARGWVAGELQVEGDLFEALDRLWLIWNAEPDEIAGTPDGDGAAHTGGHANGHHNGHRARRVVEALREARSLAEPARRRALRDAIALAGPGLPPPPPPEEMRHRTGPLHSVLRDRQAISHHYDVGNRFYERVLGPSMVYSCAYWDTPGGTLEQAQAAKLDLICRKLSLRPGQRLLDVGCGWGSMLLHAAREYGVRGVGVTLSSEQARYARRRIEEAGLGDRVEIRVRDYREVAGPPFDAVSSIGMAEHVGSDQYLAYAGALFRLVRPGGRLLNHQIARRPLADEDGYRMDEFINAYVFPDGELAPLGSTVSLLENAGFEVRDVESLREHYALTLRAWVANLEEHWAEAVRLTSPGRARVWRLYMAASALAFERNRIGVNQILAVRPTERGASGMPATRSAWLGRHSG